MNLLIFFFCFLDIAEQLGGPIENDIYGPSHRFGSRINVTRVVQGDTYLRRFTVYMMMYEYILRFRLSKNISKSKGCHVPSRIGQG